MDKPNGGDVIRTYENLGRVKNTKQPGACLGWLGSGSKGEARASSLRLRRFTLALV